MKIISTDTPYGMSLALAGIALICFSALTFMGLNYHFGGEMLVPAALVIGGIALVVWALVAICRMKQTLSFGAGIVKELILALIVLFVMLGASMPISNFMRVIDDQDKFQSSIDSTVEVVKTIGTTYQTYAHERIDHYRTHLQGLHPGSREYAQELQGASGETKSAKVNAVVKSLQRRLFTPEMQEVEKRRTAWLDGLHEVNVWNVLTPRNIAAVNNAASDWVEEYRNVSAMIYIGEESEPFSMPQLRNRISELSRAYTAFDIPNMRGLLVSAVCFALLMTPYFLTRRNTRSKAGTHK